MMIQTTQSCAKWCSNLDITEALTGANPSSLRTFQKAPSLQKLEPENADRDVTLAHL